jgi:isoleucyl-tRNA synthetase
MFKPVSPNLHINQMEEGILRFWKHHHIFERTSELRDGSLEYVFYEGPPTANGQPGVHHVLARAYKDMFLRYKTMCGFHVIRRGGWDTHGLPVELEVEKQLGFNSKAQIEEFGIAAFNEICRQSAFEYILDWERLTDRIAYWVALDDAYITYTNDYIESVWWMLKTFWDKGLLYQAFNIVPYCSRCGTPLSDHEVAQGFDQIEDPSVFVRLPLVDDPGTSLLIWTTTPWTLPGNVAVAVHPEKEYTIIERGHSDSGKERLILAKDSVDTVFRDEPIAQGETFKGKKLKGLHYHPLFTFLTHDKPAYFVVLEEFVNTTEGTGIAHISPTFNTQDFKVALDHELPILQTVTENGTFIPEIRPWSGKFFKETDPLIIEDLEARGLLLKVDVYNHSYPFCWRCGTPLLYYARETWYLRTTQHKDRMVSLNESINWYPDQIKHNRFGSWLENNVDWAIGRERYWGIPLPIWECNDCHHQIAVGSLSELNQYSGKNLPELDLHRPYIDQVHISCPQCKGAMERVKDLIDVWFDSGAMPAAQWHYPFEKQDLFSSQFPADFICEAYDQTRGWFYSLHAISTMLFDQEAYRNVICLGLILDAEGKKMSKSLRNVIDPWEVINVHGSDAFRWYLFTATAPGKDRRFSVELVGGAVRQLTLPLWNVYSFFITNARLEQWTPLTHISLTESVAIEYGLLDRWLLSELNLMIKQITNAYEKFDAIQATRPIQEFVEKLSRVYLRHSRHRFLKNDNVLDKQAAFYTLYQSLVILCKLLAPPMPLLAEELYQNLVRSIDLEARPSVHMTDWVEPDTTFIDETLNQEMQLVLKLESLGHSARKQAGIKVRQPLTEIDFFVQNEEEKLIIERYAELLADDLNVKIISISSTPNETWSNKLKPLPEKLGSKYKSKYPGIENAIHDLDSEQAVTCIMKGITFEVTVENINYLIQPDEVEIRIQAIPSMVVASDGCYSAALNPELTPSLIVEGIAREVIRQIQELRKQAGLEFDDDIRIYYQAPSQVADALQKYRDYIKEETRATAIVSTEPPDEAITLTTKFNGKHSVIGLIKQPDS